MASKTGPPSYHGTSSDEKKTSPQAPPPAKSSSAPKLNVVRPEVVTIQKDHLGLLLTKCHNLESQVQANKNLQLVITDTYTQLDQERKKAAKYQTALIQAENRLAEMVRLQLENSSLEEQKPFLAETEKSLRHREPMTMEEPHHSLDYGSDVEIDGPAASEQESGIHSTQSISQKSDYSSYKTSSLEKDGHSLSAADYEDVIRKERMRSCQLDQRIKLLENLLEAKSNRNTDALVSQLKEAQKKDSLRDLLSLQIDSLTTKLKHKDMLYQNYYQGYMAVSNQKPAMTESVAETEELENSSKDQLQRIVRQERSAKEQLKEAHAKELVQQKGLLLKERDRNYELETQLKECQETIGELRCRGPGADGDYPLTLGEMRERVRELEEKGRLYQQAQAKAVQERDRAVAAHNIQQKELQKVKNERAELQNQVLQLSEKLKNPSSVGNAAQAKLAATQKQLEEIHQEKKKLEATCAQSTRDYAALRNKYDVLKKHSEWLQKQMQQQQQQQHGFTAVSPQQQQQQYEKMSSSSHSSRSASGRASDRASDRGAMEEGEVLVCKNCEKKYRKADEAKYRQHVQRCEEDDD